MKQKYKFYKNRLTRHHPSIQISVNSKIWKNMELTSRPAKRGRYIELIKNPSPSKSKKSYIRKYVRNDPIRTRGDLLRKYKLSEEDLLQIENYLKNKN